MSRVADGAATRPISCVAIGRPVHALRAAGLRFWSEEVGVEAEEEEGRGKRALPISPNMTPPPTPPPTSLEIGFWERALLHWGEMSEGIIGVYFFLGCRGLLGGLGEGGVTC